MMIFSKNESLYDIKKRASSLRPFLYEKPSVSKVLIIMLALLSLQILALIFTKSGQALCVIFSSILASVCASSLNYLLKKQESFNFLMTLLQGIMIGMLLPENFPVISVFVISFLSLFFSEFFFLQTDNSFINMTAVTVLICWFVGKIYFPGNVLGNELASIKNPSVQLINEGFFPVYDFDSEVTGFLNRFIFRHFNVTIPEGYVSVFCDSKSLIPAFRFTSLTIIASIVLFSVDAFTFFVPFLFLTVYAILVRFFSPVFGGGEFFQGDILLSFLTGGTLFCAVFLLQWFNTNPVSFFGKIIFAISTAIIAFLTAGSGNSPVGMVVTILIGNFLSMFINVIEEKQNTKRTLKLASEFTKNQES